MHIIIQDSGFQLAGIAVSIAPEQRFPYAGLAGNPGPEYSVYFVHGQFEPEISLDSADLPKWVKAYTEGFDEFDALL